jgi:dTDP-glucose pyrophosphorylase
MKKHSFAIYILKQEITEVVRKMKKKHKGDDLEIAISYNHDIIELEKSIELLERNQ